MSRASNNLVKKLGHHNTEPLTKSEMEQFRTSVQHLEYDDTVKASYLLEPPADESYLTPSITPGEPRNEIPEAWEIPAEILASRLLALAPRHPNRYIQASQLGHHILNEIGFRVGQKFVYLFGLKHPEMAWAEILYNYQKYWEVFTETDSKGIPNMATGTFPTIWEGDPELAKKLLLEVGYHQQPFAGQLKADALSGMLHRYQDNPDVLENLLEWLDGDGFALPCRLKRHSLGVNLPPYSNIDLMALALIAKSDPQRAIQWAKKHDTPRIDRWQYAIYAGWVEFWPYSQENVSRYITRYEDAMQWLVDNTRQPLDEALIHNAYCKWNSHDRDAAIKWLNDDRGSARLKRIKAELKQHPYIREISHTDD